MVDRTLEYPENRYMFKVLIVGTETHDDIGKSMRKKNNTSLRRSAICRNVIPVVLLTCPEALAGAKSQKGPLTYSTGSPLFCS